MSSSMSPIPSGRGRLNKKQNPPKKEGTDQLLQNLKAIDQKLNTFKRLTNPGVQSVKSLLTEEIIPSKSSSNQTYYMNMVLKKLYTHLQELESYQKVLARKKQRLDKTEKDLVEKIKRVRLKQKTVAEFEKKLDQREIYLRKKARFTQQQDSLQFQMSFGDQYSQSQISKTPYFQQESPTQVQKKLTVKQTELLLLKTSMKEASIGIQTQIIVKGVVEELILGVQKMQLVQQEEYLQAFKQECIAQHNKLQREVQELELFRIKLDEQSARNLEMQQKLKKKEKELSKQQEELECQHLYLSQGRDDEYLQTREIAIKQKQKFIKTKQLSILTMQASLVQRQKDINQRQKDLYQSQQTYSSQKLQSLKHRQLQIQNQAKRLQQATYTLSLRQQKVKQKQDQLCLLENSDTLLQRQLAIIHKSNLLQKKEKHLSDQAKQAKTLIKKVYHLLQHPLNNSDFI